MGRLTFTELLAAGQGKMGNLSAALGSRLEVEFQAWLDKQYVGWQWPFLKKRATGLSLTTGLTSLTIGAGNGGITQEIIRLVSPLGYYNTARTVKGKSPIIASAGYDILNDETLADSSTYRGLPRQFKARAGTTRGTWVIIALPFPDRDLLLSVDYYELPASLDVNDIPIYPSDTTMIDAVAYLALYDQKGADHPATQAADAVLQGILARDRNNYGSVPGENEALTLDGSVFT